MLPADRVHAWRVARQLLVPAEAASSPEEVARELVGVQAQVLSAAALAVALRTKPTHNASARVADTTEAVAQRRLVRAWGMRGTLHLFAADDFPTIVAALRPGEPWRRPSWLRYFGLTETEVEAGIEAVGEILGDGRPRTRAELAEDMERRFGKGVAQLVRGSWGTFLKQAGRKGYVSQAWTGDSSVAFVRPDRWLPSWRTEDSADAMRRLLGRYLATYGPASAGEINRWWGVEGAGLKPALRELGTEVTEVDVAGERGYLRTVDLPTIESIGPTHGSVRLLGPFDPFIVGAGLRAALIPAKHLTRVSRTAGWISPVVLVDGRAVGVWDSAVKDGTLRITVEPFAKPDRTLRAGIARAAEEVAGAQGLRAEVAYGAVFPAKAAATGGVD